MGIHLYLCLRLVILGKKNHPKMPSRKKKQGESVNAHLKVVMKSGKYTLGYRSTLKTLRQGRSKLVLIANNTNPLRKSEVRRALGGFRYLFCGCFPCCCCRRSGELWWSSRLSCSCWGKWKVMRLHTARIHFCCCVVCYVVLHA